VRLHRHIFSDYFLTHMGQEFLELFYNHLILRPGYCFVARHNGQIIGFVAGTAEPDQFYPRFYQQNFLNLARIVIARTLTEPHIRRSIWRRLFHLRSAGKALLRWRVAGGGSALRQSSIEHQVSSVKESPALDTRYSILNPIVHLLSIGVANDFRGQGVAEALSDRFCKAVAEDGGRTVLLSVLAENSRAIHFYTRTGWQLVEAGQSSLEFSRSLNIKRQTSNVIGCESPITDDR
jgi:ribosomal protein S18 acetylase RimI-like enzyme